MFEDVFILLIAIVPYAALGSGVRVSWGIYKAYSTVLVLNITWKRIAVEMFAGVMFGIFGGVLLSTVGIFTIGMSLGTLVSSLLGANVIELVAKKFGWSKKMEVIVSDQQLGMEDFNQRQINGLEYAKSKGSIDSGIYQKINRVTRNVAKNELTSLVDAGRLKRVGNTKGAYYLPVAVKAAAPKSKGK